MTKIYPKTTRQKARQLRKQGWSLGEISHEMKIPKNTLSGWLKDILLTEAQKQRINKKIAASVALGRPLATKRLYRKIEQWKENIRKDVSHFKQLSLKNPEIGKLVCGILYLCEGAKYPSTRGLIFGNSNPEMIRCFLYLLRKLFSIREDKLRCRVMYRCDQDIEELNKYWSNVTKIPLNQFFKTKPDERTKGIPTKRPNYKGICAVQYSNTSLQFRLQAIGEIVIKMEPEGIEPSTSTLPASRAP